MSQFAATLLFVGLGAMASAEPSDAAERSLPPAPARWVTDQAEVLSSSAARSIDARLEAFEREQGTQILVWIARRLPEGEAVEEWTQRVAESWGVGRAESDDGAVLFAFVDDRLLRIEVGYGLEGALTDLESKAILEEVLIPRLRAGDWDGGFAAAADALIESVRGEYRPEPRRASRPSGDLRVAFLVIGVILLLVIFTGITRRGRSGGFRGGGWRGGGFGGGGFGGGGFGGGGFGGGFSGGGGSFGGGGATGRW